MGSQSDWETMREACVILEQFGIPYEARVVSAHRNPHYMTEYASRALSRGIQVINCWGGRGQHICPNGRRMYDVTGSWRSGSKQSSAGARFVAEHSSNARRHSCCHLGDRRRGAKNAGLLAARILAIADPALSQKMVDFLKNQTDAVMKINFFLRFNIRLLFHNKLYRDIDHFLCSS